MKRIILTVLLGVVASVVAMAGVLTEEQTRDIARIFRKGGARSLVEPSLVYAGEYGENGTRSGAAPAFYVYNYGFDDGFVIVSAEDTALPILAFSDKGQFTIDERMPVQVASWLEGYCEYIQEVRSGARYVEPAPDLGVDITVAVQPLLKSRWDQVEPYNNLCPPYNNVENCATGCAATAIAQIMRYHEWPKTGEGSVTFDGKIIDFSQSQYDWENMLDTYDYGVTYPEEQCNAVAKLMYDVGASAEMMYGYESAAQNAYIYRSLYTYFKYSKQMQYLVRNSMTTAEWKNRIRKELDEGRPVYYGGFSEDMTMGHAFVCDGIDETNNYFHFNWGWSGHCNGFYFLNALNPSVLGVGGGAGNFNADHVAIVGIQPAVEGEADNLTRSVLLMRKGFYTNTSRTTLGKNFYAQISNIWNMGPEAVNTILTVGMYDENGDFVCPVGGLNDFSLAAFYGKSISAPISIPKGTASGKYELRVVYGADGVNWTNVPFYHDCYQYAISVTVEGETVIVQSMSQSDVKIQATLQQPVPATLLPGKLNRVKIDFVNVGSWNYTGRIGCRLLQLPKAVNGPQFVEPDVDTLVVSQTEGVELIYSEDAKSLDVEIRLNTPADYLLQTYYIDPLSYREVLAGEWPLSLAEPEEVFERRVVIEQLESRGDARTLQQLSEAYSDNLIGLTVADSELPEYVAMLNFPTGTSALMNRVRNSNFKSVADGESYLQKWLDIPAFATMSAKANYTSQSKDSVKVTLTTRFAYSGENMNMRLAVVTVDRNTVEGGGLEWTYTDRVTGYYPAEVSEGIPSTVVVNEIYSSTLTIKPEYNQNLILVGLLIDGETGEICNAVRLGQEEIAPCDGTVSPVNVYMERTTATMNAGLKVLLEASVYPAIAPQQIVWTSSKPEVAEFVVNGLLRTLTAGTTVVRATSAENAEVYAEMEITVMEADYTQVQQVEAGYLHYLVDFDACPEKLILGGELNGTDIALLRYLSGGDNILDDSGLGITLACPLYSLDISQCRIIEGGTPYRMNYVTENDVVGKEMFKWCLYLKEIKLPNTITAIGDNAFFECGRGDLKTLEIPASVERIGYAFFYGCTGIESFTVAEGNTAFKAVDGVLYNYAGTELVAYPANKEMREYQAIETLNKILPYALSQAKNLETFTSNLRLSSIGYGAFYNAKKLKSVSLSNRLNFVGEYAFAGCTALMEISCKRATPAECAFNAFEGVSENCILTLSDNFDEEYFTAPGWDYFNNVRTSIEDIRVEEDGKVYTAEGCILLSGIEPRVSVAVYSPAGILVTRAVTTEGETRVSVPASGLYIVSLPGFNTKIVVK